MVSTILNYYCYKTLLYEALVSEYNYGDVRQERKPACHVDTFSFRQSI